ncbi:unnamed protein product [Parnassius apollo]|uniref:(apollo) hypothetical protein n=1 Tax=Parnassius apollo TaxID=110799 RepID=A0A8S3XTR1_PARAO|nr:unnamed protein product [Parnassius apollo]
MVADREAKKKENERKRMNIDDDEMKDDGNAGLFDGDKDSLNFNWSPMDTFRGEREVFLPKKTGPMRPSRSSYEAFRQYWDDDIISYITTETNRYAAELCRTSVLRRKVRYPMRY